MGEGCGDKDAGLVDKAMCEGGEEVVEFVEVGENGDR